MEHRLKPKEESTILALHIYILLETKMFQYSSDKIFKLLGSDNGHNVRSTVQNNTTHRRAPLAEHTTLLVVHTEVLINNLELS